MAQREGIVGKSRSCEWVFSNVRWGLWFERFPGHDELKAYFRHVDKILDLSKDAFFNTVATSIKREDGVWVVQTRDDRVFRCLYLTLTTGSSYKKHLPAFPGLDNYEGKVIHAADWPSNGLDVKGKKSNVTVVDLKATPIERFTEQGVVAGDQSHELDLLVLATGYDAVTGRLLNMGLKDEKGVPLENKWKNGVRTYLGLMIPDMQNLFMMYGPQAPTSFANGPPIIEIQVDLIAQMIQKCQVEHLYSNATNDAAAESWAQEVCEIGNKTLYPTADSWYMGANILGKPREMLLYLGGMDTYAQKCRAAIDSWAGFVIAGKDQKPFRASL